MRGTPLECQSDPAFLNSWFPSGSFWCTTPITLKAETGPHQSCWVSHLWCHIYKNLSYNKLSGALVDNDGCLNFLSPQNYSCPSVMVLAVPVAVRFLLRGNRELSRNMSSYLSLAAIAEADLLAEHTEAITVSVLGGRIHTHTHTQLFLHHGSLCGFETVERRRCAENLCC